MKALARLKAPLSVILALIIIALLFGAAANRAQAGPGPSSGPWPMFHGASSHTGYANVMGPQAAALKWKLFAGKAPASSNSPPNSIAISPQGVVYVGGPQSIFALDANGKILWYKNYTNVQGPAIAADGTIYFVSSNSIVALDSQGNQKWQYATGNQTIFGPGIGSDGTIYQGSWDHYFYALNSDGTLKWKYLTAGAVSYSPSIGFDGTIYLGGGDAHAGGDPNLYAFSSDGTLKWKYNTGQLRVGTPAVTSSGKIYVPASGTLIALNSTGQLQWSLGAPPTPPSQQPVGIVTPAVGSDGTLYAGNSNGLFSAVDSSSRQTKWTYQTGPDPTKNPPFYGLPSWPIVDGQGDTYVGAADYYMYAFNSQGNLLWSYKTGGEIAEAAPAMDSNGNLYFSSDDGYLYVMTGPVQSSTTSTSSSTSSSSSTTSSITTTTATSTQTTITSTSTSTARTTITTTTTATTTATATATTTVSNTTTTTTTSTAIPEFPDQVVLVILASALVIGVGAAGSLKKRG